MTIPAVKFIRHLPFDAAFTLNGDGDLMWSPLLEDKTYSEDIEDYTMVDMGNKDLWDESDEKALVIIYETLLNIRK